MPFTVVTCTARTARLLGAALVPPATGAIVCSRSVILVRDEDFRMWTLPIAPALRASI